MITKIFKLIIFSFVSFSFAQNNTLLNVKIEGMHCAGGCAKMIENSLNQNEGISAAVDFQNSSATVIYNAESLSAQDVLTMINGYRNGKFSASLNSPSSSNNNLNKCSKGKNCCQKTGAINANCDNKAQGCCSAKKLTRKQKKNQKAGSLANMIPGHTGCTKSCCSGK